MILPEQYIRRLKHNCSDGIIGCEKYIKLVSTEGMRLDLSICSLTDYHSAIVCKLFYNINYLVSVPDKTSMIFNSLYQFHCNFIHATILKQSTACARLCLMPLMQDCRGCSTSPLLYFRTTTLKIIPLFCSVQTYSLETVDFSSGYPDA